MNGDNNNNAGYITPSSQVGDMSWAPAGGSPLRMPQTQEQRGGQEDYGLRGLTRNSFPEESNSDYGRVDPRRYNATAAAQVPTAFKMQGDFTVTRADYNRLANYEYVRRAADFVGAAGRNDQDEQAGVATGNIFRMEAPAAPNWVMGFFLEWSLGHDATSAFTMKITTTNFKGQSWQSLDRAFDLRIGAGPNANGGIIGVLFGSRQSAQEACGYYPGPQTAPPTAGYGGMSIAMVQPAWIPPTAWVADETFVQIPGLAQNTTNGSPFVSVEVPSNITPSFSVLSRYITAGSPQMSDMRQFLNLEGAPIS
jgi:hypothetical protein